MINKYHKSLAVSLLVGFNSLPPDQRKLFEMEHENTIHLAKALESDLTNSASPHGQSLLIEALQNVRYWLRRMGLEY